MMGTKCRRCGCEVENYSSKDRFKNYCKSCRHIINSKKDKVRRARTKKDIGTTDMSSKMSRKENNEPDFDKEKNILDKELRDLGLKK